MKLFVTKLRLHYPLLFILIIAIVSMQWTSAHIHLAENHDHDGMHYHEAESHAHNLTGHYSTIVDSSHLASTSSTIDLDSQYNAPSGPSKTPNKTPDLGTIPHFFQFHTHVQTSRLEHPFTDNLFYNHLDLSAANPRAPPYFS